MSDTSGEVFKKTGRPPAYETPEEMQAAVNDYFISLDDDPPTITGLALHLGFESRQSFYDYERKKDFTYTIKRSRLAIEERYERRLHNRAPTGAIFALKNMGWKDSVQHDVTDTMRSALTDLDEMVKDTAKYHKEKGIKK